MPRDTKRAHRPSWDQQTCLSVQRPDHQPATTRDKTCQTPLEIGEWKLHNMLTILSSPDILTCPSASSSTFFGKFIVYEKWRRETAEKKSRERREEEKTFLPPSCTTPATSPPGTCNIQVAGILLWNDVICSITSLHLLHYYGELRSRRRTRGSSVPYCVDSRIL